MFNFHEPIISRIIIYPWKFPNCKANREQKCTPDIGKHTVYIFIRIQLNIKNSFRVQLVCLNLSKGVLQWSQYAIICNWISISPHNLHKMIPCEHLSDVWYRVSQNSIFFLKWPLQKSLNIKKNFNFSNYCKARQYILGF